MDGFGVSNRKGEMKMSQLRPTLLNEAEALPSSSSLLEVWLWLRQQHDTTYGGQIQVVGLSREASCRQYLKTEYAITQIMARF